MNPTEPLLWAMFTITIIGVIILIITKRKTKCIHEYEDHILSIKRHCYSSIIHSTVISKCKLCGHIKDKP
jgi:hypothetical protein